MFWLKTPNLLSSPPGTGFPPSFGSCTLSSRDPLQGAEKSHKLSCWSWENPRDHQMQLLHPRQEGCAAPVQGGAAGEHSGHCQRFVCVSPGRGGPATNQQLLGEHSAQCFPLTEKNKNEIKRFQLPVKFPAPAPKHRRAGIIQRMSLQCSLSYQNEAFCLQLRLRNSRVVWMRHSRTLQPLPEPRGGKFQPKDPRVAEEEEEGAEGRAVPWEALKFPIFLGILTFPAQGSAGWCRTNISRSQIPKGFIPSLDSGL